MKRVLFLFFVIFFVFSGCKKEDSPYKVLTKEYNIYKNKDGGFEFCDIFYDDVKITIAKGSDADSIKITTENGNEFSLTYTDGKLEFFTITCPSIYYSQYSDFHRPNKIMRQEQFFSERRDYSIDYTKSDFIGAFEYYEPQGPVGD